MKKVVSVLLSLLMLSALLGGCGKQSAEAPAPKPEPKKIKIVTTIFPVYDWTRNILGGEASNVELTMLLKSGADMHSYQPTADDLVKLSSCDVLIYVGGESDQWIEDARKEAVNKNMVALRLMDVLGERLKHEEEFEGMTAHHYDEKEKDGHKHPEEPADHKHEEHKPDEKHEHHDEYDEHIWLSLKNAALCADAIADALSRADAAHAEAYKANVASYLEKLVALDRDYAAAALASPKKTLLFGDRFPFRYLVDDYGLKYYAAFPGCSAETEASFETIAFLSAKLDELKLPAILTIEGGSRKVAETILYNTPAHDQKILVLDSMQSTPQGKASSGQSYLDVMRKNLDILKEALR
ncbi:MAG: zinc ABC transporter substrate-binding protein [Schwartzia sp.]|nr:zinc ABC transporter substrate-binding protein [Schwartzia sp. (in: firmicutes)]